MRYFLSAVVLIIFIAQARASMPALCLPSTGDPYKDLACEYSVRAKEYALRHWYVQALEKATYAHLLDYGSSERLVQLAEITTQLVDEVRIKTFLQVAELYPEWGLVNEQDLINKIAWYSKRRDLAKAASVFAWILERIGSNDWPQRVLAGNSAYNEITGDQLRRFNKFQEFNIQDMEMLTRYNVSGQQPPLGCSAFYPFQFGYSMLAVAPIVAAINSFSDQRCRNEGYRALIIQAFRISGGALVDSKFMTIPLVSDTSTTESLEDPAPVLRNRIADIKLLRAIADSIVANQRSRLRDDITREEMRPYIDGINSLFGQLGTAQSEIIDVYKGLIDYTTSKGGLLYLKLAARFSDEIKMLERKKR